MCIKTRFYHRAIFLALIILFKCKLFSRRSLRAMHTHSSSKQGMALYLLHLLSAIMLISKLMHDLFGFAWPKIKSCDSAFCLKRFHFECMNTNGFIACPIWYLPTFGITFNHLKEKTACFFFLFSILFAYFFFPSPQCAIHFAYLPLVTNSHTTKHRISKKSIKILENNNFA